MYQTVDGLILLRDRAMRDMQRELRDARRAQSPIKYLVCDQTTGKIVHRAESFEEVVRLGYNDHPDYIPVNVSRDWLRMEIVNKVNGTDY